MNRGNEHESVLKVTCLPEPPLEFADGQIAFDPHDGLSLYGPVSLRSPTHPSSIGHVVISTPSGTDVMTAWSNAMNLSFAHSNPAKYRLWPPYPGFEAAFGTKWQTPTATYVLDRDRLLEASRKRDPHERCFAVVEQFLSIFEKMQKLDAKPGVALCVIPDEVWSNCRPRSRVAKPSDANQVSPQAIKSRKAGQGSLFEPFDYQQYELSPDFRRQLKARAMRFDVPLQIIRESTLRLSDEKALGARNLTPLSDRMWNLGTALYYKAGGKPWKLRSARDGVCYVGLAFRLANDGRTACCAAQMFLDSGDGIVFLGEYGPWYSPEKRQFRLERAAAERLLRGVLDTYADLHGKPLKEVFLHSRSSISRDEFAGFSQACPPGCKLVAIRVRHDALGPRLFRPGTRPVLRGTFHMESETSGLLYASGFKPRLGTYDGWETPVPLRIDIQHGDAPLEQVASDILGLTKLNYNACKLGEGQPVTVKFSDDVGEILVSNPAVSERRANFKFYI